MAGRDGGKEGWDDWRRNATGQDSSAEMVELNHRMGNQARSHMSGMLAKPTMMARQHWGGTRRSALWCNTILYIHILCYRWVQLWEERMKWTTSWPINHRGSCPVLIQNASLKRSATRAFETTAERFLSIANRFRSCYNNTVRSTPYKLYNKDSEMSPPSTHRPHASTCQKLDTPTAGQTKQRINR